MKHCCAFLGSRRRLIFVAVLGLFLCWGGLRLGRVSLVWADAPTYRQKAQVYLQKRDLIRSAGLLEAFLFDQGNLQVDLTRKDVEPRLELASVYRNLQDYETSVRVLEDTLGAAAKTEHDRIRLELQRSLYARGDRKGLRDSLEIYRKMSPAFYERQTVVDVLPSKEIQYLAGMSAFRLGKEAQAEKILSGIPSSSGFYLHAQHSLGEIFLQKGRRKKALKTWRNLANSKQFQNPYQVDSVNRTRISLGKLLLLENEIGNSERVFARINSNSRFYQEAQLGRAWAISKSERSDRFLESLVFLKRVVAFNPHNLLAAQAGLMMGKFYFRLGTLDKSAQTFRENINRLDSLDQTMASLMKQEKVNVLIPQALEFRRSEGTQKVSLELQALLSTRSAFEWLPLFEKVQSFDELLADNLRLLSLLKRRLKDINFDPYLLQHWSKDGFSELINDEILQNPKVGVKYRVGHRFLEDRLSLLDLLATYSQLLIEERQWENASRLIFQNALSEKIKQAEILRIREKEIRNYYLSPELFDENASVLLLNEKIQKLEEEFFLEDRLQNQIEVLMKTAKNQDKRLRNLQKRKAKQLTEGERRKIRSFQKRVAIAISDLNSMQQILMVQKGSKKWRRTVDASAEMVANPQLLQLTKEISQATQFLERIQVDDEAVRQELLLTISQMQRTLTRSHAGLDRYILYLAVSDLIARKEAQRSQLARAALHLRQGLARSVADEMAASRKEMARYQSRFRFELAKVLDSKAFKR